MAENLAIEIAHVSKTFGANTALEDVSLHVPIGGITGLVGPNGAGKTTALRILVGLSRASAGTALFYGIPFAEMAEPGRIVGAVLDPTAHHPGRTGHRQLQVHAAALGVGVARITEVVDELELGWAIGRRIGTYSLGMQQRLSLAMSLLGSPRVLVLDEPGNGLDPDGICWLRNFLIGFAREGNSVLLSSHLLGEVAKTVDEVVFLNRRVMGRRAVSSLEQGQDLEQLFVNVVHSGSRS